MPNWAEGTLKIRGEKENVIRFLKEGIIAAPNFKMTEDGPVTVPQKSIFQKMIIQRHCTVRTNYTSTILDVLS